jgi:hypothetical protein
LLVLPLTSPGGNVRFSIAISGGDGGWEIALASAALLEQAAAAADSLKDQAVSVFKLRDSALV